MAQFGGRGRVPTSSAADIPLQLLYADNIVYTCCTASVKMSIVLLFRRIFVTRSFKHITAVLLVILSMWWMAVLLTQIFSCTPVDASWIPPKAETCVDTLMFYNAVTISNVIFDFILLILPMPVVWKLHIDYKKKLQVCGVFLVGTLYVSVPMGYFLKGLWR